MHLNVLSICVHCIKLFDLPLCMKVCYTGKNLPCLTFLFQSNAENMSPVISSKVTCLPVYLSEYRLAVQSFQWLSWSEYFSDKLPTTQSYCSSYCLALLWKNVKVCFYNTKQSWYLTQYPSHIHFTFQPSFIYHGSQCTVQRKVNGRAAQAQSSVLVLRASTESFLMHVKERCTSKESFSWHR